MANVKEGKRINLVYYVYQIIFSKEIELIRDLLQELLHVMKKANKAQDLPSARWRTRKVTAFQCKSKSLRAAGPMFQGREDRGQLICHSSAFLFFLKRSMDWMMSIQVVESDLDSLYYSNATLFWRHPCRHPQKQCFTSSSDRF